MPTVAENASPLVILGVGNPDRGDDGIGPALVARLDGQCAHVCIDAGTCPENVTGLVKHHHPSAIVIVDAVDMGLAPGTVRILDPRDLASNGFSTHTGSLYLVSAYLEHETGAPVRVAGVQPESVNAGMGLSGSAARAVDALFRLLCSDQWNTTD